MTASFLIRLFRRCLHRLTAQHGRGVGLGLVRVVECPRKCSTRFPLVDRTENRWKGYSG